MRHHAVIVSGWNADAVRQAHARAREIFGDSVTEVLPPVVNGHVSFFVGTDGSKEGWADSDAGDARREQFKAWVLEHRNLYLDVAEVQYADEAGALWVRRVPDEEEE